jgi:GDP-4-dehydro-6-deoxy-D-mannose reductase
MRVFVTGVSGFAGSFLAREMLEKGYDVSGTYLPQESLDRIDTLKKDLGLYSLDLTKPKKLNTILKKENPEYIVHLAAQSSVGRSFKYPQETYDINFYGTYHLIESALNHCDLQKFVLVSSADVCGVVKKKDMPLSPDHPPKPVSPYGLSKAACEMLAWQYFKKQDFPAVVIRAFNHSGPGQERGFVIPDFCSQIAALEKKRGPKKMRVGNLSAKRDISDVRDIVVGYRLALEYGKPGKTYNLCGGRAYRIETLLKKLLRFADADIQVETDPKLSRPSEVPILTGDISKTEKQLGYKLNYQIDDTLKDCLNYYRSFQGGTHGRASG